MAGRQKSKDKKSKGVDNIGDLEEEIDKMENMLDQINMHKIMKHLHQKGQLRGIADELGINIDVTTKMLDTSAEPCAHCGTIVDNNSDGVSCQICEKWYHYDTCSGISSEFKELVDNPNIWFVCNTCKDHDISQLRKSTNSKLIEGKLDELLINSEVISGIIQDSAVVTRTVANNLEEMDCKIKTVSGKRSYAETLKTKKALVIKCADETLKAADKKKAIMEKITAPVEEVKMTKEGHLYVRFEDKSHLEKARNEFEADGNLSVSEKGKLKPKIKLVNVPKDEDDILDNIKKKNPWLSTLINEEEEDLKIIKEVDAKNSNYKHCIIKCSPQIRKAINDNDDKVHTLYSHCKIFDWYMPYQCYKCQEFGHTATRCNKNQVCPKCNGNHRSNECASATLKCGSCARKGYSQINHRSFDQNECAVYKEEISKIRNNTDHGFD